MAYRIVVSPALFDLAEPLELSRSAGSDVHGVGRRVTRTPTLDGGAVLQDLGATDADRVLVLEQAHASAAQVAAAKRLARVHPRVTVATEEGVFLGALESVQVREGTLALVFWPISRLTEA